MTEFITDKEVISKWLESQLKTTHRWRPLKNINDLTGWNN